VKKSLHDLQAILQRLQQLPKETEWFEFKEAKQNFDFDDLGKYFSGLSNEANLHGEQAGWLVFGVNDKAVVVGSQFRPRRADLDSLKHEIAKQMSNNHSFVEIYELQDAAGRVILFQIPPAPAGMPIAWKGHFYGWDGDSLVALNLGEIEQIRRQHVNEDWSIQIVANASLKDLDPAAIAQARANFKQRQQNSAAVASVDDWDDTVFLDRAKLTVAGKITRAAVLLLGRPEAAALLSPAVAQIAWRLEGEEKAYEHFGPPFLLNVNVVFRRIRNVRFRLQPFGQLIPVELEKYDAKVVLEALNNCLAHQDYTLQSRVVVTEFPDRLVFENAGTFFEGTIDDYVLSQKTPQHYRNPFLAHAMVNLNMIDTMGYGIQRMFAEQRKRFFPLPDYDLSEPDRVRLVIHGKLLDENYSRILISQADLPLHLVIALDRVQKKLPISDERITELRRLKLVEGRKPNLFPASKLAAVVGSKAEYVRYRAFDDAHYKDMIRQCLGEFGSATRAEIDRLLQGKLSDFLTEEQKQNKIQNLLAALKDEGIIERVGPKKKSVWKLKIPN
jgi:ATP-dependent DNA helicase RecG